MKENIKFFLDIILISIISLAQGLSLIVFNGVKPNFALAALVILIFSEKEFWRYLILVLTSLVFLNYSVFISKEVAIFGLLMLSVFYFKKYLSENIFLYSFLLTSILTTVFYLLIDFKFIFSAGGGSAFGGNSVFISELFYNVLLTLIFGSLYYYGYDKE